jgi:general nucleoside transport system ATP-binding protein
VPEPAIILESIEKSFGRTRAVDRASLTLIPGRVHAIVGENGAGKSTLLKIAGGVVAADAGRVLVLGRELSPATPTEAIRRGVAMVHQHFMLVEALTGLENLALGNEPTRFGVLDLRPLEARINAVARSLDLVVPLQTRVSELSIGERQRLELLRALVHEPKVLILDEPTAVLAPREADAILALARELAKKGMAIALVTHHLDEVARFADEVTVMRRGAVVAHHDRVPDVAQMAREAVGEEPPRVVHEKKSHAGKRVTIDLSAAELKKLELTIAAGEIVGVAGVEGNGQHALERALVGSIAATGRVTIDGHELGPTIGGRRAAGVAWIPSDRHAHGIAELPARDVVRLGDWPRRGLLVDEGALTNSFFAAVKDFDVRPDDPHLAATSFSGGNQQKLVIARELRNTPKFLVAAHPTRGVDVRAAATIRRAIVEAAASGAAVLIISSDLDELRTLSDRILVLRGGLVARELPPEATVAEIGSAMLGAEK